MAFRGTISRRHEIRRVLLGVMVLAAAAACGATARAQEQPERVYRWTDASGQESFTNDIQKVPEPWRSKYLAEEKQEKAKKGPPKGRKYQMVDIETITRKPFKDYQPEDTRAEDEAARVYQDTLKQAKDLVESLKATLKKKTEELNLAAGWETILHTPKYKQDKLRLLDEVEKLKTQIADAEKRLDDVSKQKP